jgi:CHAT domain-containing protein
MKKNFTWVLTSICFALNAQFGLDKLTNVLDTDLGQKGIDYLSKEYDKSRKDYEDKAFNYAIIVSDNAALFENEQKYKKYSSAILGNITYKAGETNMATKASSTNSSAELLYASHKYKWAENMFLDAKNIYETYSLTDESGYSLTLSNLGLLYNTMGRFEKSQELTQQALELRLKKMGKKSAVYAASVNNMGVLLKDMGMYHEAGDSLDKALDITGKSLGKESLAYAIILNNKAMLQYALGQYPSAVKNLTPAIETAEKELGKNSYNLIRLKTNLALLFKDMDKLPESEEILQKCIKIKEKKLGTSHPDYANLINILASLYLKMNKIGEVENLLKKASNIYKKELGEEHPSYANSLSYLGNFYLSQKKNTEAEGPITQALAIRKKSLGENHQDYLNSLEDMALLYWLKNDKENAEKMFESSLDKSMAFIKEFFPAMSEIEKSKLWAKTRPKLMKFYAFTNQYQTNALIEKMYELHIATKGILLGTTTKVKQNILSSKNKSLIDLYEKWLDQKAELARLYTYSKAELVEEKINLDSLEKATDKTEKKLSLSSDIFGDEEKMNVDYKQVMAALKPLECGVEIINFHKFNTTLTDTSMYAAIIVSNSEPLKYVAIPKGYELDKKYFNYYKNSIANRTVDKNSYNKYWAKIDSAVNNKKTLFVSTDGIYSQLNINTLALQNNTYSIDKYNINYILNTKFLTYKSKVTAPKAKKAVLLGFPDYGNTGIVTPLPGTKIEIEKANIQLKSAGFATSVFLQNKATETNLKAIKSPYLLHVATHGYFQPDANEDHDGLSFGIESQKAKENPLLRGGLLLADAESAMSNLDTVEVKSADNGIFTAYEAMNLDLNETEIVFLSACETGKGESKSGEGVYGLQRAIQVAGAKTIIMSLWKVSDEATQKLINLFYAEWLKTGNKSASFIKAQKQLKLTYPDPLFWGAFVMI